MNLNSFIVPIIGSPGNDFAVATPSGLFLLIGGALVLAVRLRWAEQRVVGRRQPAAQVDLIAVDDAVRASTVHLVSGPAPPPSSCSGCTPRRAY